MPNKIKKWLDEWDAGKPVWSVDMGALGPSYEQAIQVVMVEMLRYFYKNHTQVSQWGDRIEWEKDKKVLEEHISKLKIYKSLTGAQYDGAISLAAYFYKHNMNIENKYKKRRIMICNNFSHGG